MKLIDQVITLSQAKRLKELGVKQKSQFLWEWSENGQLHSLQYKGNCYPNCAVFDEDFCAFTVAELGVMLPTGYDTMRISTKVDATMWQGYDLEGNEFTDEPFNTEAQCRAAMLIHLIETETITVEEVNVRLCAE